MRPYFFAFVNYRPRRIVRRQMRYRLGAVVISGFVLLALAGCGSSGSNSFKDPMATLNSPSVGGATSSSAGGTSGSSTTGGTGSSTGSGDTSGGTSTGSGTSGSGATASGTGSSGTTTGSGSTGSGSGGSGTTTGSGTGSGSPSTPPSGVQIAITS